MAPLLVFWSLSLASSSPSAAAAIATTTAGWRRYYWWWLCDHNGRLLFEQAVVDGGQALGEVAVTGKADVYWHFAGGLVVKLA